MEFQNTFTSMNKRLIKATLLLTSSMTVMAGATIAPSLPQMSRVFENYGSADILAKLVLTLPAIFIAAAAPTAGWITDRFGRKRLLLISLCVYALAGTTGLYLTNPYAILAGRALLGISVGGIMTVSTTLIGDYLEGEERQQFLGIQGAFMALGGAVFVTLGGLLADIGWRYPFGIYGASLLLVPLVLSVIYEPESEDGNALEGGGAKANVAIPKKLVAVIYGMVFIGMILFYMVPVQIPFLLEELGTSNSKTGLAISVTTLTAALFAYNYRRIRSVTSYAFVYGLCLSLMAAGYGVISFAGTYEQVVGGLAVSGAGAGLLMPNSNTWALQVSPLAVRGRIIGGLTFFLFLGQFCSPLATEPINSLGSIFATFGYAALSCILLIVLLAVFVLARRRRTESKMKKIK